MINLKKVGLFIVHNDDVPIDSITRVAVVSSIRSSKYPTLHAFGRLKYDNLAYIWNDIDEDILTWWFETVTMPSDE